MSGVDKYAQSNFSAALVSFQNYNKRFPDGFFAEGSNYYAAECFRKEGDFENAKKMYKNVVQFSANEFTVKSWVWILRIASQEKFYDLEEIEYAAQALLNISNDAQFLREANTALMRTYQSKGDVEVAQAYSKVVASDDRNSPELREEANLNMVRNNFGFWLKQKKSLDNDSIAWKKMDNLKVKTIKICDLIKDNGSAPAQAETSYYISCFLNFEKNYLGSNEEIFWLIDNLPGQAKWRYKALLILAKNYAGLEDDFQAMYTLDFIISENYSEDLTNDALKLKNEIEASKQKEPIELDSAATIKEVQ
jgi:tetratricopeptide (TPR) repeat protein